MTLDLVGTDDDHSALEFEQAQDQDTQDNVDLNQEQGHDQNTESQVDQNQAEQENVEYDHVQGELENQPEHEQVQENQTMPDQVDHHPEGQEQVHHDQTASDHTDHNNEEHEHVEQDQSHAEHEISVENSEPEAHDDREHKGDLQYVINEEQLSAGVNVSSQHGMPKQEDSAMASITVSCSDITEKYASGAFFISLKVLQDYMQSRQSESGPDDINKLRQMVEILEKEMNCLKSFCEQTQSKMKSLSTPLTVMTEEITHVLPGIKHATSDAGKSIDELNLELHKKIIETELAKINNALLEGSKLVTMTESAVVEANQAIVDAVETAKRMQAELEERQRIEAEEAKRVAEEARLEEEKRIEEEKKAEAARLEEELRFAAMKEAGQSPDDIQFALHVESRLDFDSGVGCFIHARPEVMNPDMVHCELIEILDAKFMFMDNEELISHVIEIRSAYHPDDKTIHGEITLSIPHCMTRQQAATREPVIRMEHKEPGSDPVWNALATKDVLLEGFKDTKFAQVEHLQTFGRFVVVSQLRKELIKMKKRGGTVMSKLDERIQFISDEEAFATREKMTLQVQPVDSQSLTETRRRLEIIAKTLLCTSPIFRMEWTNRSFESTVLITVPLPPNPITMRKLAGARSAREEEKQRGSISLETEKAQKVESGAGPEARDKEGNVEVNVEAGEATESKPVTQPTAAAGNDTGVIQAAEQVVVSEETQSTAEKESGQNEDEGDGKSRKKDLNRRTKKTEETEEMKALWRKPIKWYMGQYGKDADEDERDQLFVLKMNEKKKRWTVESYRVDTQVKGDVIRIELPEPVNALIVLRMTLAAKDREAEQIADEIDRVLSQKLVTFILKQSAGDPCNVVSYVIPITKKEKLVKKLTEEKYTGPEPSEVFSVKEGDKLCLTFRGNIQCVSDSKLLTMIFCTNLDTKFSLKVRENDIFLQKSYDVYRGFVQLRRIYEVPYVHPEAKSGEGDEGGMRASNRKSADASELPVEASNDIVVAEQSSAEVDKANDFDNDLEGKSISACNVDAKRPTRASIDARKEKQPELPLFEIHMDIISELLLTFPKDLILLRAVPPIKSPITYRPDGDPITPEILLKICQHMPTDDEWMNFISYLDIDMRLVAGLQQRGILQRTSAHDVRNEIMLHWVKKLKKSENKLELLCTALSATKHEDINKIILDIIAASSGNVPASSADELESDVLQLRRKDKPGRDDKARPTQGPPQAARLETSDSSLTGSELKDTNTDEEENDESVSSEDDMRSDSEMTGSFSAVN